MSKNRLQDAYLDLKKYFGIFSQDTFLSALTDPAIASGGGSGTKTNENDAQVIREIRDALFSDTTSQKDFRQIVETLASYNSNSGDLDFFKSKLCFTDYDDDFSQTYSSKVPFNEVSAIDQGTGGNANKIKVVRGFPAYPVVLKKNYDIRSMFDRLDEVDNSDKKIYAIQFWPADTPSHSADADIAAVFLNSITTIVMSQAVPYVDILVSTGVESDSGKGIDPPQFSLGRFLGVKSGDNDFTFTSFSDQIGASVVGMNLQKKKKNQQAVASMEIFTTPQTLVDASPENVRYNDAKGGPHDIFRPYMSLDSFNVQVISAQAGFISKKTADMKITLFDKGRLSSIAALVSPLAYNTVQFDITYGWSHPSGKTTAGRPADAQFTDRLGQLIDAMKVTDTFTVVNNNFSFNADGTVSIDLKLVSTAMNKFTSRPVRLTSSPVIKDVELDRLLNTLTDKLASERFKNLNLPTYLNDNSSDNFLSLTSDQIQKVRKITASLIKKSKTIAGISEITSILVDLAGNPNAANNSTKKGQKPKDGVYQKYQQNRIAEVGAFIDELINTPDPFLPRGDQIYGVNDKVLGSSKYASLGKILIKILGPQFQETGEVIFVFGCLNQNAAAVRDNNISQFPIKLRGEGNEVYLQKVLEEYYKRNNIMSPQTFIELIIENFIDFQGNRAYGLSEVFEPNVINKKTKTAAYQASLNKQAESSGGTLFIEQKKIENLKNIYRNLGIEDTSDAKFVTPKLTVNVDCRKTADGSKNVVRVNVFDAAADPSKGIGDVLNDVLRTGFVLTPPQTSSGKAGKRTPNHGERMKQIIQILLDKNILQKATISDAERQNNQVAQDFATALGKYPNALEIVNENVKDIKFMKKVFSQFLPTITVGSTASGVTDAKLSSQQNQSLATQAISRAINQTAEGTDPLIDYGMVLYPTQLSLEVFGSPVFKYFQRFFVDFGTNTSADNFYAITAINYNMTPGSFKCNLTLQLNDVFARTINLRRSAVDALAATVRIQREAQQQPKKKKKK